MSALPGPLIKHPNEVEELAANLRRAGRFAIDLEFVSESRYIPELCLVQVAWLENGDASVAAVDPLATDPRPVVSLVQDDSIEKILHSARSDLSLLADRLDLRGTNIFDCQIAAAFLGLGEQIGFARLVGEVLQEEVDKTEQFTDWKRRPLSDKQLRYALLDALHLLPVWKRLQTRLEEKGRLGWVREESEILAKEAATRRPPEETYLRVKGWTGLHSKARGVLRELAAWREREALRSNRPPSWILQDKVMLQLARRAPRKMEGLRGMRGLTDRTVQEHGQQIMEALSLGARRPMEATDRQPATPDWAGASAGVVSGLIQERCREEQIATKFVAPRADIDALMRWWSMGDRDEEPQLALLKGWRRELVGQEILDWLAGASSVAHRPEGGLRIVTEEQTP